MEAFFILVAFVLVLVPVVLPIVSFLTARGARTRVLTLERQLQEQERALDAMKGELAALRRESRPAAGAAVAANEAGAARTQPAAPLPIGPPAAARPPVVPPEVLPAPHVTPVLSPPVERPAATPPAALAPPPPPSRVEPRVPASPAPAAAAAGLRPGAAAAGAAPSGAEVRGPAAPRGAPPPPRPPVPPAAPPRSAPAFDWENLVGVKLFATMAGVALVIGAVFFLRHSIDQGWLQPPVRVLIGIISAIALLVGCEMKAARKYPATANALDAAAIAILFATFFAAYALWDLIPGGLAFVLLGLVTALAVLLSIRRDSLFIAVLGLLGGFATPILLSTGENRPIPLFAYLLLLNVGLAWIAYRNTWPILTVLTLVFTTLYQWGWVLRYLDAADLPLAMAIFLVFPVVTFAGVLVRRPGRDASGTLFQQTAVGAAVVPILFAVFLAAVPAYGVHAALFFGFLLLIDTGLLAVAAARQQRLLRSLAAAATVVAFAVWLGQSYVSDARLTVLAFTALFVLLFLLAEPVAARFGLFADSEQRVAHYAAPILLFVFPALAALEPSFVAPLPLFGTLLVLLLACAWRAMNTGDGYLYFIAAFFSVAAQAVWSVEHISPGTLRSGVLVLAVFGLVSIAVPLFARARGRALQPAGGAGLVLLASLGLLLYLSTGPVSLAALWALALLLAILNAGLFVEAAGARLPLISMAGSVLSWFVLASWWFRAAGSVGVLSSMAVLVGLALLTAGGHAWASVQARRTYAQELRPALRQLLTSGLFLGLVGHLFLLVLALDREWSLPPWPLFGSLAVITLGASAAALYARASVLHGAAVVAASLVVVAWTTQVAAAPWPLIALVAAAGVSAYTLGWISLWGRRGEHALPAVAAAAVLFVGELTAMLAIEAAGRPSIVVLIAAHLTNLAILLVLTWRHRWPHVAIAVALTAWLAVVDRREPWNELLALASSLYLLLLAFPFVLGRRVAGFRDAHIAAVVGSAMFFFTGREALLAGGYGSVVGVIPVIAAVGLALLLRQLLQIEVQGQRDLGRLALVAGAALGFVTVAIPVQLQHQWITIGWALEGAALAWLFTRVPHRGLLYFAAALLLAVFARLALNPEVFRYEPRGEWRIFNWYLYTYMLAVVSMLAAARWLWPTNDTMLGGRVRPSRLLPGAAVVLLFILLNIEIADFYATGREVVFRFGSGVSQDLTYTISWLVFGMLLLAAGIYTQARPARVTAVALIAITAFKCFLYDLGSLGGLYRVGSFIGLGISLALVSIVLQKYVLTRPREAQ